MGWNGSNSGSSAVVKDEGRKPSAKAAPSFKKGIIAGLIVVVGAGFAAWWIGQPGSTAPTKEKNAATNQIAEVKPQIVTQAVEVAEQKIEKPKPVDPNARPTKVGEVVNGYVKLPSGRIHKRTGVITNNTSTVREKAKYEIFDRRCNNEIACLLTLRPGDTIVGTPRYNGRFKQDFIASINEPIIVTQDDTPEQARLKRDVIAARLEMKDALDRGEDIEQIMLDTRQELQDMMRVKQEFKTMFNEGRANCETDQDVEDLLNACNKMLEEKGIAPLKYGPITRRNLLRAQQAEQNKVNN